MVQEVILNGRPHDLDYEPSLQVGTPPLWRTPIEINGRMVHGVNINGYDYPPAPSNCVLYYPGLPAQGATIWDRSKEGNHGTVYGATWIRLPSGLWCLSYDGVDNYVDCGTDTSLDFGDGSADSPMSILAWIYPDDTDTSVHCIAAKYRLAKIQYNLLTASTPVIAFQCMDKSANAFIGRTAPFAEATYVGKWTFIAATYSANEASSGIKIYANRTRIDNADSEDGVYVAMEPLDHEFIIGRRRSASTDAWELPFDGKIALLRIIGGELTLTTITRIFNQERHLFGV